jgi:hypothetical protein
MAQWRLTSTKRDLTTLHDQFATIYTAGARVADTAFVPWRRREVAVAVLTCEAAAIQAAEHNS